MSDPHRESILDQFTRQAGPFSISPGIRDEAALARELEEELNVRPRIGARVAEIDHDYSHLSVKILFYRCFLDGRELLHPREHAELRWVRPSELTSFDFLEADLDLVEQLKDGKL